MNGGLVIFVLFFARPRRARESRGPAQVTREGCARP